MRLKIIAVTFLLAFVSSAAATDIRSESVTIDLEDNSVVLESDMQSISGSEFSYVTSVPVENVEGTLNGEPIECNEEDFQIGSEIQCNAPVKEDILLRLDFTASNLVEERNGFRLFEYTHSVYRPTEIYNLTVILPEDSGVAESTNRSEEAVIPGAASIGEVDGRTEINWSQNPRVGDVLSFRAVYETETQEENTGLPLLPVIAAVLLALVIAYILTRGEQKEVIELDDDEQEVVDIIEENDGEMLQKDVVSESEYSKAKISGVVSSLVDKDVVSKEKEGRSNKLVLKDR